MDERAVSCCFTGHRSAKLPWGEDESDERCLALKAELNARLAGIYDLGYRHFLCGMAIGCDLYFAEAALALRDTHPEVTVEAVIPCLTQADSWPAAQRARYEHLVASCDSVKLIQHRYSPGCMMRRNQYMVDASSLLLACFDGQSGGTMNTIVYAKRQGLQVIVIGL